MKLVYRFRDSDILVTWIDGELYSTDPVVAQHILDDVSTVTREYGVIGLERFSGSDIVKDAWAFHLWFTNRVEDRPSRLIQGELPKIPKTPKGAVI